MSAHLESQRLVKENELLKTLLLSLGLESEFLKTYMKAAEVAPRIAQAVTHPLDDESCCHNNGCSSSNNMQVYKIYLKFYETGIILNYVGKLFASCHRWA
jgi:hypothetical protein